MKPAICFLASLACAHAQSTHLTWSDYGGAPDSAQYSALTQINRTNVTKLKVAWRYSTGDANKYFFNPLAANGLLYVLAKNNSIVALDQKTGKEVWTHATGSKPPCPSRLLRTTASRARRVPASHRPQ